MDQKELFQDEFRLIESWKERSLHQGWEIDDVPTLIEAYEKLLQNTVKLTTIADQQFAWLLDSREGERLRNNTLEVVSSADRLTGLLNRHRMEQLLQDELGRQGSFPTPLSLILIDVDHFKMINDTWGHGVGDEVLVFLGQLLKSQVREGDWCGRWGGDEFLVLLPDTNSGDAIRLTEQLRKTVATADFPTRSFTVSMGVVEWVAGMTREDWLSLADRCLYWAKRQGRNRIGHPGLVHGTTLT